MAVCVDTILALTVRLDELGHFLRGDRSLEVYMALAGLVWIPVLLVPLGLVLRSMFAAARTVNRQDQTLEATAATSPDWLWETDSNLTLTYCSDRVCQVLGYPPEDLIGRSTLELVRPDQVALAEETLRRTLRTGAGWNDLEIVLRHADGSDVLVVGGGRGIRTSAGVTVGLRGAHRVVSDAMLDERDRAAAVAAVLAVIAARAVDIALQPIVDLGTGSLVGAEALARFPDGASPDSRFAQARAAGLATDLDRLTFFAALDTLAALPTHAYLSVNASPDLILHDHFLADLLAADLPLDRLVIEITEHVEIRSYEKIQLALAPLRARGVRIAIDDTGAGFASFSHVLQIRPDIIKIDRALIQGATSDPARRAIITSIMLLAVELQAQVTAEGIETPMELETLATLGADCGQGYLLARPSTERDVWNGWHERNWLYGSLASPQLPSPHASRERAVCDRLEADASWVAAPGRSVHPGSAPLRR